MSVDLDWEQIRRLRNLAIPEFERFRVFVNHVEECELDLWRIKLAGFLGHDHSRLLLGWPVDQDREDDYEAGLQWLFR